MDTPSRGRVNFASRCSFTSRIWTRRLPSRSGELFVTLVHSTLATSCAASRFDGSPSADPTAIWLDLGTDSNGPWAYARTLQSKLGVALARLLPERLGTEREPNSSGQWAEIRSRSGRQLQDLMYANRKLSIELDGNRHAEAD